MSWLNRILNNAPQDNDVPSPSTGFFDIEGQPVPLSLEQQDVRAARELIRTAGVRTTASFGIPANWLSYEVVTIADDEKAYFQLQVSMRIWDEELWAQSGAYEQHVLKRIREDDVNVARAVRAVLWRILPDAGCPHDELSGAAAWRPEAVKARAAVYERMRSALIAPAMAAPAMPVAAAVVATVAGSAVAAVSTAVANAPTDFETSTLQTADSSFGDTMPVPIPASNAKAASR